MLKSLVQFSLRFRGVVVALACVVVAYGLYVTAHTKLDVFPEFAPPLVVVQTEAPGLSPEEVEQLVTRPVENSINGAGSVDSIRSQSIQGLSVVTVIFREGTDIWKARQMVAERLVEAAAQMPQGVHAPTMAPLTSSTSMMYVLGLTSKQKSAMELRTFADWTLRPRLLGVPGVAKVNIFGGDVRQIQVQAKPERLLAFGLAFQDVVEAAQKSTGVRGAGFVETAAQRVVLRTQGQSISPQRIGATVLVHHEGTSVRLEDVADVVEAPEPKIGDGAIAGQPGVLVVVSSQFGANTMEVTEAVEKALEEMKPAFDSQGISLEPALFRPANFITSAIANVRISLLIGAGLVALVLCFFLLDLRTAFISFTAIPISLLAAVIVLDRFGISLNTITLGGFAIAIGIVVDDAIIDVENIWRRLRENRTRPEPRPVFQVVLDASLEVRSAVVYATFVVALVFLPVLTMSGVQGRLFAPLATSFILSILASLGVALTVTPALSLWMLARAKATTEPSYIRWLKARHAGWLQGASRQPGLIIGIALVLSLGAAATLPLFGGAFLPEFREGHFIVHMSAVPGTSLEESLRIGKQVSEELRKNPKIKSVSQQAGRAEQADDTFGTHYSEFHVELVPLEGEEAEFVQSEIRDALMKFPGLYFAIKPFLTERIEETISGATAEVAIKIYGDDLDTIDRKAREIVRVVSGIDGAADVQVESPPGVPEMVVRLRPERLEQFGFRPVDVLEIVQTAYQGRGVAQTYDGNRVFDVAVILSPAARQDPEGVGELFIRNSTGTLVQLSELTDVYPTTGRYAVLHEGARRRQAVTCNVRGRDLASFVAEAKKKIGSEIIFPAGVYPVYAGAAEAQAQARRDLLLWSAIAGAGILVLLAVVFGHVRNLLLILANLPFALVGGVLAVFLSGGWLSVGSLVGFVTLFGITMRNSIMMVSHWEHLVHVEGMAWGLEAAVRGATERLVPILMTALVTALGLLPLAIGSGEPGREIEGPMAIVILGGLVTSTLLNLLVLPSLALKFGRFSG